MITSAALKELNNLARGLGITRLADITGLDVAGLPVVQAVRPFSLSNAVSQGKGQTIEAATFSAIFESAESFAAERLGSFEITLAAVDSVGVSRILFEKHLLSDAPSDWHTKDLAWIDAKNLSKDRSAMVPLELVHTAYVSPQNPHDGVFCASTTGLAAAFVADDAIRHGMLECIERDAIARALNKHGFLQHRRIDVTTIDDIELCNLIENLRQRGFLVGLWHAPSPVGVPVIWCHLMEDCDAGSALMPFPAEGSAARLLVADAAKHAIYEAAQSRLTAISGARDDFTRRHYPKYPDWQSLAAHRKLIAEGPNEIHFAELSTEQMLGMENLLSKIAALGHGDIYCVDLDCGTLPGGIFARKIIIPHLLPLLER
jgi:YcaO-like protein with predicted kinase domain